MQVDSCSALISWCISWVRDVIGDGAVWSAVKPSACFCCTVPECAMFYLSPSPQLLNKEKVVQESHHLTMTMWTWMIMFAECIGWNVKMSRKMYVILLQKKENLGCHCHYKQTHLRFLLEVPKSICVHASQMNNEEISLTCCDVFFNILCWSMSSCP